MLLLLFLLCMIKPYLGASLRYAKQGCEEKCGNVLIPYPFGIGSNCSIHDGFAITCNNTFSQPKPFLKNTNLEVLEIELDFNLLFINNPIISSGCSRIVDSGPPTNLSKIPLSPFSYSPIFNRFVSTNCNHFSKLYVHGNVVAECKSICNASSFGECNGINCCQTPIPFPLKYINASLEKIIEYDDIETTCKMMFVANKNWIIDNGVNNTMGNITYVPAILNWQIYDGNRTLFNDKYYPDRANCLDFTSGYLCRCGRGFEGNPYLPDGCGEYDECGDPNSNDCAHYCRNLHYKHECYCRTGYIKAGNKCIKIEMFVISGTTIGLVILFLLIGCWWVWKLVRQRKQIKRKKMFFRRNGGLLLQQQISSDKGNLKTTKLFTSKELEKATENYNVKRVIGQGGQGTVYKGMLTDGNIVAVKKAKLVDQGQLDVFINELVVLLQINHRNIVKLLGCCLETEVPMLVYEYIPNGTLYQYVHNQIEEFQLSWSLRLRIASEVAGALFYLHSAASVPIYHRDIKSMNILLDEKYVAKIADFGMSRLISIDQTHLTTAVKGTFGYLDPEYFRSNQLTEKSDVYSFGVVLVELLTGQKVVSLNVENGKGLVSYFMLKMEENNLFDIIDPMVAKEGEKKEILEVANLALRCLNLNGKQRPTMREVSIELQSKLPKIESSTTQHDEEFEYPTAVVYGDLETSSPSSSSFSSVARD